MRTKLLALLALITVAAGAVEFDPLHREFGINVGPLGRFDGNGVGITNIPLTALTVASQAQGDIIYFNGTSWVRLPAGTSGKFLQTLGAGANPTWATVSSGSFNGSGLTLTNTSWNTDKGITIASLNQNGTFTIVDTNGNTRFIVDPILDTLAIYDSNSVAKILVQNQKMLMDAPIIATGTLTGNVSGATNANASNLFGSGTVPAARGGAGNINGILKANGSGTVSAATANTDYLTPSYGGSGLVTNGPITTSGLTMNTSKLLGRTTASAGQIEEISVSGATLSGGVLTISGSGTGIQTNGGTGINNLFTNGMIADPLGSPIGIAGTNYPGIPPLVILDNDIGNDRGDAVAVSQLAIYQNLGLCKVLALGCVTPTNRGAALNELFANYYGLQTAFGNTRSNSYFTGIQTDHDIIATNYFTRLQWATNSEEVISLYRSVLANSPRRVRIGINGMANNISDLLRSPADMISPLTGVQLVSNKVESIVIMAGDYPYGYEWNSYHTDDQHFLWHTNVPPNVPLYWMGYSLGTNVNVPSTAAFSAMKTNHPLYVLGNGVTLRAWDALTVQFLVFGTNYAGNARWDLTRGSNYIVSTGATKGSNTWFASSSYNHYYVTKNSGAAWTTVSNELNSIISRPAPPEDEAVEIGLSSPYINGGGLQVLVGASTNSFIGKTNSIDMRFPQQNYTCASGNVSITNVTGTVSDRVYQVRLDIDNQTGGTMTNYIGSAFTLVGGASTNQVVVPNGKRAIIWFTSYGTAYKECVTSSSQ